MITKLLFLLSESLRALIRAKLPAVISSITIGIALIIFSMAYFTYEIWVDVKYIADLIHAYVSMAAEHIRH